MGPHGVMDMLYSPPMTPSRLRTIGWIIPLLLVTGILVQVLYDPVSSVKHSLLVSRAHTDLPQARARWESLGIADYSFEIQGSAPMICQPSAIIEVGNKVVIKVETKNFLPEDSPARLLPPEKWADPDWGDEVFLCSYFHFTMPQFFDLVDDTLRNFPSSIMNLDFDPQYGYVSQFKFGTYVGYGLARPRLSNCCNTFEIRNFRVLAP